MNCECSNIFFNTFHFKIIMLTTQNIYFYMGMINLADKSQLTILLHNVFG